MTEIFLVVEVLSQAPATSFVLVDDTIKIGFYLVENYCHYLLGK